MNEKLNGKTIYGFGDSLVCGHCMKIGMLDYVAKSNGMVFTKYAIDGATVIPEIAKKIPGVIFVPDIAAQIASASSEQPDFVCLDGMTNDAYPVVMEHYIGQISEGYDGGYDTTVFCGAFERICYDLQKKYPSSRKFYICPHKMPSRDIAIQEKLHGLVKEMCGKWHISVIDMYEAGIIDTCVEELRMQYSYDNEGEQTGGDGTHLNEEGYRLWYAPAIEEALAKCCE